MVDLVKRATKLLHGSFDIEIIEKHHNQKIDAPSGTALLIADAVNSTLAGNEMKYVYDRHSSMQKEPATRLNTLNPRWNHNRRAHHYICRQ